MANTEVKSTASGAVKRKLQDKLFERLSVKDFNVKGDGSTDDTTAWNSIVSYVNTNGSTGSSGKEQAGFLINIPSGAYVLTNLDSIDVDNVFFVGHDPDSTIILGTTGEIFKFGQGLGAGSVFGGGIINCKFLYPTTVDATSCCIRLYRTSHMVFKGLRARRVACFARLGDLSGGNNATSSHFIDIMGYGANIATPFFDLESGSGFRLEFGFVHNNADGDVPVPSGTDPHAAALGRHFISCAGDWDTVNTQNFNCNRFDRSINVSATGSNSCSNWFFSNFYGDFSKRGMRIHSDGGNVRSHNYQACWFFSSDEASITLQGGVTGLLENIKYNGVYMMGSGQHGVLGEKGTDIHFTSCHAEGQGRLKDTLGTSIGTGDGSTTNFTGTLSPTPIEDIPDIRNGGASLTNLVVDVDAGTITADELSAGSINADTGAIDITFSAAPADGNDIAVDHELEVSALRIDGLNRPRVLGGTYGLADPAGTNQAHHGVRITANAKRYHVSAVQADGATSSYKIDDPAAQAQACRVVENHQVDGALPSYQSFGTISAPTSGVTQTNTAPFHKRIYFRGGDITGIQKGGESVAGATSGFWLDIAPGETWVLSYNSAPTVIEEVRA